MNISASAAANVAATPLMAACRASRLASIPSPGHELLPHLDRGRSIGPADLRPSMTHAFAGSDVEGFRSWEGALDTVIAPANAHEAALGLRFIVASPT